jgi:murein DD-endopeptidase MepM/ murein hydrolase activator NlpD
MVIGFSGCPRKKEPVKQPVYTEIKDVIKKGENLDAALCGLAGRETTNQVIGMLMRFDFPFRRCLPGDSMFILKKDNVFEKFTYFQNRTLVYYVMRDDPGLLMAMKYPYIERTTAFLKGEIASTLYETMLALGETPDLVYRFADIFAWEIDFTTETQNNDSFFCILEKNFCDSVFIGYTHIPLVHYKGFIGDFHGVYFQDPDGYDDYYNLKGESLRKALLKSPLKYSHISSYFSKRRYHPILKIWRPHHGLDYSAPIGTPVSSIGDGVVTFKGWKGGYGNLVEIRHKNSFKTRYGHLSRFAKDVAAGKHVKMGQLIGYVGSTGLSTGPHLHFEMHKDNVPINPLTVKLPRAPSVKKEYVKCFEQQRDSLLALFAASQQQLEVAQ